MKQTIMRNCVCALLLVVAGCTASMRTAPTTTPVTVFATSTPSPHPSSTPTSTPSPSPTLEVSSTLAPHEAITLTILYDNQVSATGLNPAWGFACLVERNDVTLLFDTGGNGELLLANMAALGKDPRDVDVVVLSHPHDDHIGGLSALLATGVTLTVYLPHTFPTDFKHSVGEQAEVIEVREPGEILHGITTTGPVRGPVTEIALAVRTGQGDLLLTGCAHPGVARMVQAANDSGARVATVIGGYHLSSASHAQIQDAVSGLLELEVRQVAPTHCSGQKARAAFATAFPEGYLDVGVGTVLTFQESK